MEAMDASPGQSYYANSEYWIGIIRGRLDKYRIELTDRAVLAAVGECANRRVLDAGCGEGYLSRILHSYGAQVVGIDACADLICAARDEARRADREIIYHLGIVEALPLENRSFDYVVCNHLVNDLPDPASAFREFGRVLEPGGKLVVMMLHPCFHSMSTQNTESFCDKFLVDEYFSARSFSESFLVAGRISPVPVRVWMRSLEDYLSAVTDAGFTLTAIQEPRPTPDQFTTDPWWRENFRLPTFLQIIAERTHDC
ncbi:class I SAM-dependent methyltransferase [Nocardia terpenica]|uniref:class I SAM-dependent methyltransferase n=1 Tax=Nocardia terpenica TaxID=455432 RepID=UPI0002D8790D|nr:class I SAM-dependent methyltransferase [Nocardia terpenica]NQE90864.1 methyltransferase domain-containing protein [Nocardia terpenica]